VLEDYPAGGEATCAQRGTPLNAFVKSVDLSANFAEQRLNSGSVDRAGLWRLAAVLIGAGGALPLGSTQALRLWSELGPSP